MNLKSLTDILKEKHNLSSDEFYALLSSFSDSDLAYANACAREVSQNVFGNKIFTRGLIEISNFCRNDCLYCGIRRSNNRAQRYRLTKDEILECCREGYALNFRTFVLQGGEGAVSDDFVEDTVRTMRAEFPDCAITLSLGERAPEAYQRFFDAGANRYLLRHETANAMHYARLHPAEMSFENRLDCLHTLKKIGYQTGTGMMVGSPFQSVDNLVEDIQFIHKLQPEMIGLGPFISHHDTPFAHEKNGSLGMTLMLISIFRLMFPHALIPATTSLATLSPSGRERGILAGANVVMPNLSPPSQRKKYLLYDNKACINEEAAESRAALNQQMKKIGYELSGERGDYLNKNH